MISLPLNPIEPCLIQRRNGTEMTSIQSNQKKSPMQIFGVEEHLAKMFQLQECEKDYQETEVVSFLDSLNSSRAKMIKINTHLLSLKMLKEFYQVTEDMMFQYIFLNFYNY